MFSDHSELSYLEINYVKNVLNIWKVDSLLLCVKESIKSIFELVENENKEFQNCGILLSH